MARYRTRCPIREMISSMADTAKLPTHIEPCKLESNSDDHGGGYEYRSTPHPDRLVP